MKFVTLGGEITLLRSTAGAPLLDLDRPSVPIRFPTERRCPQEIFDCIIDELADDPYTLRSLSLTCQDFLLKSRSYLFSTVCLGSDGKNYSGLVHTISRTPILASYIRTLYVEPGLADIGSVFVRTPSLLPHLQELWLISLPPTLHHSTPFFCTQLLSVANLHLKGCQFFSFDHFWRLVISFRNLRKLYFQSITWERPSLFKDFARIPSRDRPLRLAELYGRGNDVEINTVLSWYIAISKFTKTLVSLTLDLTGGGGGHLDTSSSCETLNVLFDKYSTSLQTVQLTFAESDLEVEGTFITYSG
ncbi:hypothetical protein C8Q75DRAFT_807008 [Abortiporus biennis]|nr:hypothetical protein C8Q75DRAFT_807008 [Abortiporus biennis]